MKQLCFVFAIVALICSCKTENKNASSTVTDAATENTAQEKTGPGEKNEG